MTEAPATTRTTTGQFVKGVSGNPAGRPRGRRNEIVEMRQELEIALRSYVKADEVKRIINKLIRKAQNGNIAAAKLILDKVLPNASDADDDGNQTPTVRVFVENVTVGAPVSESSPHPPPIDGEFTEVAKST